MALHKHNVAFILLCFTIIICQGCENLPSLVSQFCACATNNGSLQLNCKGLNSTQIFSVKTTEDSQLDPEAIFGAIQRLSIQDSPQLKCIGVQHLAGFTSLKNLSVISSGLKSAVGCISDKAGQGLTSLEHLTISGSKLAELRADDFLQSLQRLRTLNVSHNEISNIAPNYFAKFPKLSLLDLSNNKLTASIKPSVFKSLPKSVQHLDISNNTWACSSDLAWMHGWKSSLADDTVIKSISFTRCIHDDIHTSKLFLVMKYYDEIVLPHCPTQDGCSCLIHSIQETLVNARNRHYTVHVNCAGQNLLHFPILPEHTQAVDLSNNKLNDSAFSSLDVKAHHYDEVENLTLDGNKLENLPEKLLDMNLGMRFSAKNNQLTSISYDVSQKLIKTTDVLELSNNPWTCTCSSQINDLNLLAKVFDRRQLTCGQGSDIELQSKKIVSIDPEVLCPPSSNGESQELLLQLLCVLLAFLIVLVLSKLAYDFRVYRTRGQLPWLALKMH